MLKVMKSKTGRYTAWVAALVLFLELMPLSAFASSYDVWHADHVRQAKLRRPDVQRLSGKAMKSYKGRGYRNSQLSGDLPIYRSFCGANANTGNLMQSFTDIQVAPAKGAGLALQRTYNSNDERIGPFGRGWTHAYDLHYAEPGGDYTQKTDFFGGKHVFKRDADGLYTPPPYLHSVLSSDYGVVLQNGPTTVNSDTEEGTDGTIKHYKLKGFERVCDRITDRYGNSTVLTYVSHSDSPRDLLDTVTDPSGRTLQFTWTNLGDTNNPVWRITEVDSPVYNVTYDYYTTTESGYGGELYNLKAVHLDPDGLNRKTTYRYTTVSGSAGTEVGMLSAIVDPLQHATTYDYAIGQQVGMPAYAYVSYVTESTGVRSVMCDPFLQTLIEPDVRIRGALVGIGVPSPLTTGVNAAPAQKSFASTNSITYDQSMNTICSSQTMREIAGEPRERDDLYTYGPLGNVLSHSVNAFPGVEKYSYYDESKYFQKSSVTDMASTEAHPRRTSFDYGSKDDANVGNRGNVLWAQDAVGNRYTYTYNSNGQKTSETNPMGVVTRYTYGDQWGNLTKVVQDPTGLNRITTMTYDAAGRVTDRIDPKGQHSHIAYNSLGQPVNASFYREDGQMEENVSYTYGGNGRLQTTTDNRGTTVISYVDGKDVVHSVSDPVTGTISYGYDNNGNVTSKTLPGGGTWSYTYNGDPYVPKDDLNSVTQRLESITDETERKVTYLMTGYGHVYSCECTWHNNGVSYALTTDYQLDVSGDQVIPSASHYQLARITTSLQSGSGSGYVVNQNDYTYDVLGNRIANTVSNDLDKDGTLEQVRTEAYTYDFLSRLTNVDYGDGEKQDYSFDEMGNRRTKTTTGNPNPDDNVTISYTYDNANMLKTAGGNNYTNDDNGNTLTGGGRTNTWDCENRLIQCTKGLNTSTFTYGSDGLRRSRTVTNSGTSDTTYYALDGQNVVREMKKDDQGQLVNKATYLTGAGGPVYRRDDVTGTYKWYVYDGLGSVVSEVDDSGTPSAPIAYDVYGGQPRSGDPGTSPHKFCGSLGHASDAETGLVYMRARYMDPSLGRFVSEDPGRNGLNWYVYAVNNPINRLDPSGTADVATFLYLTAWVFLTAAVGALLDAVVNVEAAVRMTLLSVLFFDLSANRTSMPIWKADLITYTGFGSSVFALIAEMCVAAKIGCEAGWVIGVAKVAVVAAFVEGVVLLGEMDLCGD